MYFLGIQIKTIFSFCKVERVKKPSVCTFSQYVKSHEGSALFLVFSTVNRPTAKCIVGAHRFWFPDFFPIVLKYLYIFASFGLGSRVIYFIKFSKDSDSKKQNPEGEKEEEKCCLKARFFCIRSGVKSPDGNDYSSWGSLRRYDRVDCKQAFLTWVEISVFCSRLCWSS